MQLSIITINYNNCDGLKKTIDSVVTQTFSDFEYVVIDGGSTDGSVEVIKEYADRIDYWVSERDKGIYNAMNKGAFAANGDYLLFLNSGDVLCTPLVLQQVLGSHLDADIVCGNIVTNSGGGLKAPEHITMEYFINGSLPHPSSFIKRKLFDEHPYDEQFRISGDWEFFLYHLVVKNVSYQKISVDVSVFDTSGISSTTNRNEHDKELRRSVMDNILKPRIFADYKKFMGDDDIYFKLFYTLSHTHYKRTVYRIILLLLKILMMNRGWVKQFPFKG